MPFLREISARGQHRRLVADGLEFRRRRRLTTAAAYPGLFGSLLLQSASLVFTDIGADHGGGPVFDPVVRFMNAYRARPRRIVERIFMTCGMYEPLIVPNRSMVTTFPEAGMEVNYVESRDGHNWENWRDRLRDGLTWLYPGDRSSCTNERHECSRRLGRDAWTAGRRWSAGTQIGWSADQARPVGALRGAGAGVPDRGRRCRGDRAAPVARSPFDLRRRRPDQDLLLRQCRRQGHGTRATSRSSTGAGCSTSSSR